MKKKCEMRDFLVRSDLLKILLMMKFTVLFLLIFVIQLSASVYSQETKLKVNFNQATIKEVIDEIEKQTDLTFFFSGDVLNINQTITLKAKSMSVDDILNAVSKQTGLSLAVVRDQILVKNANSSSQDFLQQHKSISGKVTDSSGTPLPGVTVLVKGKTNGTVTNANGEYSLANVLEDAILQFSFIGMKIQEIPVLSKTNIDVTMKEDAIGIEEVVAIGYGVQKKANLTGSVAAISSQTIASRPATNPTNLLQGRIAGLQVTQPSGQPGRDDANFQIRGLGSFGASSSPLILVDGVTGSLSNIAPNDIESITVLKDAASASIYGSRAANGVILVTTKQAKEGAVVEYQFDIGIHSATRLPEVITNSAEYMEMYNSARERAGFSPLYTQEQIDAYRNATDRNEYPNFDWLDYYFNPATVMNHYLSLSNVKDKSAYKFSMNYLEAV